MTPKIKAAKIEWDNSGVPSSTSFDDPYFSREDGLAESNYVFLEGNDLANRFARLMANQNFVVAETGFGTGLNFLLTWRCFEEHAPKSATLTYISIEGYPLRSEDLKRCLAQWPELQTYGKVLETRYPALVPGHHWRLFAGRVGLKLVFDQLEPALQSLHPKITHHNFEQALPAVDAWFLDGFAPSKNPDMWQSSLYPSLARLSKRGTSLSSFTAAGLVRRNLVSWGFEVEKIAGFGKKREMICAKFREEWKASKEQIRAHSDKNSQTWHLPEESTKPTSLCILGAGIAGLCLAKALANRGVRVNLYDRHTAPARGASGNPQVAIFGRLSPDSGDLEDFVMQSLAFAADFYSDYWHSDCGENSGLLQLARSSAEEEKMQRLVLALPKDNGLVAYLEANQTKEYAGIALHTGGLWFEKSGWISPTKLAEEILKDELINFQGGLDLRPTYEDGLWRLRKCDGELVESCEELVISSGAGVRENSGFSWLPIKPVAGQVNLVRATESSLKLKAILSKTTSICPANQGIHCLGGSYRLGETSLDIRPSDNDDNLFKINEMINLSKVIYKAKNGVGTDARVGVRATTPDYLPLCGRAPDIETLNREFESLSKDAKTPLNVPAPSHKGLYLNVGYGSRGYAYAPLCAEHLAALICGQSSPLPNSLQRAVHPARFPIRNIIRGR